MTRSPFHFVHRRLLVAVTCLCAAAPYDFDIFIQSGKLIQAASYAKDGGNGGGQGNGSGNGNGGGNGNAGGASNGNSGGNSGNSGKNGANGESGSSSPSSSSTVNGSSKDDPNSVGSQTPVNVHHRNGFSEAISKGRYTMRDPKGRVVIDRNVKPADLKRLQTPSD